MNHNEDTDDHLMKMTIPIIYSYTVNANLMLICIELSESIIYCKHA